MDEQEKRKIEAATEEKKKDIPWWQRLSPLVLGVAGILGFLIIRSVMLDKENRNLYLFWGVALIVVLYLIAQAPKAKIEEMITPKEAELLVERECERKKRWEQFPPMSKYRIGPVSDLQHRDGRGVYYDIAVEVVSPYENPKYYVAKVMPKGIERGFVTMTESIGPITGREKVPEKSILPDLIRRAGENPLIEKLLLRGGGREL